MKTTPTYFQMIPDDTYTSQQYTYHFPPGHTNVWMYYNSMTFNLITNKSDRIEVTPEVITKATTIHNMISFLKQLNLFPLIYPDMPAPTIDLTTT